MDILRESHYIDYLAHMLDEAMLTEGKHWPEDYKKTAFNTIKASDLGKQAWYKDTYIHQDIDTIASDFAQLAHRNSNLGYFAAVIRWFIQYSGTSIAKYQEFIERKLNDVIQYLQLFVNDERLVEKYRDDVKQKFSYEQFIGLMKPISDKAQQDADDVKFEVTDKDYNIIPIMSYEKLHALFGGPVTGYKTQSEWCHTNGKSTYESWTSNYTRFFFVLAKKSWKDITPPEPSTTNAYDEYGTSLMAILVSAKGELLNCTLRWNHVIDPATTKPSRTVDKAFISFAELSQVTGLDVKTEVDAALPKMLEKAPKKMKAAANGKLVYHDEGYKCYVDGETLTWCDNAGNQISVPRKVTGILNCSNTSLTSLAGLPQEVNYLYCSHTQITDFRGCPQKIKYLECTGAQLTSLAGIPRTLGTFVLGSCNQLTSLKYGPEEVGTFVCYGNSLTSLEGMPVVTHMFEVGHMNTLTTLHGIEHKIDKCETVAIEDSQSLTSLEGLPDPLNAHLVINDVSTLDGCPKKVHGNVDCTCIHQTSLEDGPTYVQGRFLLRLGSQHGFSLKGAPGKCKSFACYLPEMAKKVAVYKRWKLKHGTADNSYPG